MLTGDWYHFQDAWDALPADLAAVLTLVDGTISTSYDPAKTESDGNVPGGCTTGGIDMSKGGGGLRFTFTEGVLQLLVNLHFTGDRTYKLNWTLADGTKGSKTTEKMKKQTLLSWNVLEQAGISDGQQLRSLELLNNSTSGGARIYDVYIRVPDNSTVTAIANRKQLTKREQAASASVVTKRFTADGIVIEKNGVSYSVTGQVRSATKD